MKKQSFILSAIILALGGFFAKAIGAFYKIPLANILGSAGMGIYYLIFPMYSLLITFCSSGISVALTTEVAKCRKIRHRYNEQKLLQVALILGFLLSLICTIVIIVLSKFLAEKQGNITELTDPDPAVDHMFIGMTDQIQKMICIAQSLYICIIDPDHHRFFRMIKQCIQFAVSVICSRKQLLMDFKAKKRVWM